MKDEDQKDLGIGIPGTYFIPGKQAECRKLAIIKMNLIKRNPVFDTREPKFISGLKHELGHMFGMDHENGTLMDPSNHEAANHPVYSPNQIRVLNEVLTIISR
jgi:predicted Zn-dependent protease